MQGVRALKAFIKTQNGLEWPGLDQLESISEVVYKIKLTVKPELESQMWFIHA